MVCQTDALIRAVWTLYNQDMYRQNLYSSKSNSFPVTGQTF